MFAIINRTLFVGCEGSVALLLKKKCKKVRDPHFACQVA
jgi:hypothetical protein